MWIEINNRLINLNRVKIIYLFFHHFEKKYCIDIDGLDLTFANEQERDSMYDKIKKMVLNENP